MSLSLSLSAVTNSPDEIPYRTAAAVRNRVNTSRGRTTELRRCEYESTGDKYFKRRFPVVSFANDGLFV